MQPRTREVLDYLGTCRSELERAVTSVPEARRTQRPAADAWSVAEVLEHLNLVEGRIARLLAEEIARARAAGLGPEGDTSPIVPTVPVSRLADRSERIVARESALPTGVLAPHAAWSELEATRRILRAALVEADGLALSELVLPHPRLGPLNVYQWVVFVGAHESRHAAQVREVGRMLERSPARTPT
ncbi:MAG: DinB family protein [Gemmatimonadaceae bacterium]